MNKSFNDIIYSDLQEKSYEYEPIFYKFDYNYDDFKNIKNNAKSLKKIVYYILFENGELYKQMDVKSVVFKNKLKRVIYLSFD